jgi:hypothetical protein
MDTGSIRRAVNKVVTDGEATVASEIAAFVGPPQVMHTVIVYSFVRGSLYMHSKYSRLNQAPQGRVLAQSCKSSPACAPKGARCAIRFHARVHRLSLQYDRVLMPTRFTRPTTKVHC